MIVGQMGEAFSLLATLYASVPAVPSVVAAAGCGNPLWAIPLAALTSRSPVRPPSMRTRRSSASLIGAPTVVWNRSR